MKKFLFIIPKVFYIIVVFVSLICSTTTSKAQVYGCHVVVGMSSRIFYTPYGPDWQTVMTGTVTPTGETGGYRSDGSSTYGCIANIGGPCTVYQQYEVSSGPPQVIGMRVYRTGFYASIDPMNCPIDDYVPALFIFTTLIFFFKNKNLHRNNEGKSNHGSL